MTLHIDENAPSAPAGAFSPSAHEPARPADPERDGPAASVVLAFPSRRVELSDPAAGVQVARVQRAAVQPVRARVAGAHRAPDTAVDETPDDQPSNVSADPVESLVLDSLDEHFADVDELFSVSEAAIAPPADTFIPRAHSYAEDVAAAQSPFFLAALERQQAIDDALEAQLRAERAEAERVEAEVQASRAARSPSTAVAVVGSASKELVPTREYQGRHSSQKPNRHGRIIRKTVSVGVTLALLATIVGILVALVGAMFGLRSAVVLSGSMRPTMQVGDLVVSRAVSPLSLHPGDLVTFRSPAVRDQTVTHRVVSFQRSGNIVNFVTKGDANQVTEKWHVAVNDKVGLGLFHLPYVGRWLVALTGPVARTVLIALVALIALSMFTRRFFRAAEAASTSTSGRDRSQRGRRRAA